MHKLLAALAVLGLIVTAAGAETAAAQQGIDPQWAQQFIGSWDVRLNSPDGQVPVVVNVREEGESVVLVLGNGVGESEPIRKLSRVGEALVASYDMNYQGMQIDTTLRLQRAGEQLATDWSFASGAFETRAIGTKR